MKNAWSAAKGFVPIAVKTTSPVSSMAPAAITGAASLISVEACGRFSSLNSRSGKGHLRSLCRCPLIESAGHELADTLDREVLREVCAGQPALCQHGDA